MSEWMTSAVIKFAAPGGVKLLESLTRAAAALERQLTSTNAVAEAFAEAIEVVAKAAEAAYGAVDDFAKAIDAVTLQSRAAGKASRSAASGFGLTANAAGRATTAVDLLNRSMGAYAVQSAAASRAAALVVPAGRGRAGVADEEEAGFLRGGVNGFGAKAEQLIGGVGGAGVVGAAAATGMRVAKDVAEVGAGFLVDGYYNAQKLQGIETTIGNITGASRKQMDSLDSQLYDVGNDSGLSAVQTAQMFLSIARQTQGTQVDGRAIRFDEQQKLLSRIADFQVVVGAARHLTPEQSTESVLSLAHLARQFDPKSQERFLDTALRMIELMPDTPQRALTQLTYAYPIAKSLSLSDDQTMTMMVALSRFGMGKTKGGASFANLLIGSLPALEQTKHAQGGKLKELQAMGVIDAHGKSVFFPDGKPGNLFGFLDQLNSYAKKVGTSTALAAFKDVFHVSGARLADIFIDPTMVAQLHAIEDAMKNQTSLSLKEQAKKRKETATFQEERAWHNFESLATEVGKSLLPGFTKGFKDLGDQFHNAQKWLHEHREMMQAISRTSSSNVIGIENLLMRHQGDFVAIGQAAQKAFQVFEELTPELTAAADATLYLVGAVAKVVSALESAAIKLLHINPPSPTDPNAPGYIKSSAQRLNPGQKTPHGQPLHGTVTPDKNHVHQRALKSLYGPGYHQLVGGTTQSSVDVLHPTGPPLPQRGPVLGSVPPPRPAVIHRKQMHEVVHHHHHHGDIIVNGAKDVRETARHVKSILNEMASTPLSEMRRHGTFPTHAHIPLAHSNGP